MSDPWFDPTRFASLYGGVGGGVFGSLAGCLGALAGVLAPRGKGRKFVLGSMFVFFAIGVVHLVSGLVALVDGQPYGIWYPLVLLGIVVSVVMGCVLPAVRKRYEDAEQRRIDAEGIRRND